MKDNAFEDSRMDVVVLISAQAEWKTVISFHHNPTIQTSPFGPYFFTNLAGKNAVMFCGGWGKVSAAASTQYVINKWHPRLLINIGTCGGIDGRISVGETILADETIIYDIFERMGNPLQAIQDYTTHIDLSYLSEPFPQKVRLGRLVSADQDLDPANVRRIVEEYEAAAADWESGAIAWTAHRNSTRVIILRCVSDLVRETGGDLYNNDGFMQRAEEVMLPLLKSLPNWVRCAFWGNMK